MTSWVLFKFKSSKEPQRITFDGTGITVFELKREIINISGLGDGTDFDLLVYDEASNDEYDDDTAIVPRSSMVVARRLPAARPGHGKAARYVSGRMPVSAKNSYRTEKTSTAGTSSGPDHLAAMNNAKTEQDKIAAMFAAEGDQWKKQQQEMANAKPVFFQKGPNKKPNTTPDRPLPPGYVCFRCTQKGHWIYDCPTNDDPNFDAKHRIKRTTGIPRSFMKRVDKADLPADGGDDSRPNKGFMIDADGNHVMVMPDTASWAKFEASHKASTAKKQEEAKVDEELQELGFDCPIDHVLFVVPSKTPCCSKTYCHGCIEDALVNNDLVCPNCGTENVLIDDLLPDTEVALKIKAWQDEKAAEAKAKEAAAAAAAAELAAATAPDADKVVDSVEKGSVEGKKADSPKPSDPTSSEDKPGEAENEAVNNRDGSANQSKSPSPAQSTTSKDSKQPESSNGSNSKKRPADEELKNDRIPTAPAAMRKQSEQQKTSNDFDAKFLEDMQKLSQGQLAQGITPMPFSTAMGLQVPNAMMGMPNMMGMGMPNNMSSMPMNVPNAMAGGNMNPMMMGMPNMMGMSNPMAMQNGWAPMGQMNVPQQNGNFGNSNYNNGTFNNGNFNNGNFNNGYGNQGYGNQGWQNNQQWNNNQMGQQQRQFVQNGNFAGNGNFRPGVNKQAGNGDEDNAYFRQPVNPFRHQKQKRMRPSDYREL